MDTPQVLEINAALWNLTEGKDIVASAKVVINYATTIPSSRKFHGEGIGKMKYTDSFSGQTEYGNVTLEEEKEKSKEFSLGLKKERIGQFRLHRVDDYIYFHHFWASSLETSARENAEGVQKFVIRYDPETLEPEMFGHIEECKLWGITFLGFRIEKYQQMIKPLYYNLDLLTYSGGSSFNVSFGAK